MTSDNIIRPAAFRVDADDRRHQQLARQRARLRDIESAPGKRGIRLTAHDQLKAALVVGRLVQQARSRNITVAAIKAALPGSARLDRYMVRPGLSPDAELIASSKLLQKVRGYLEVASVVARLTGGDEDTLKIEVLVNTSLWSRAASDTGYDDPRPGRLAIELAEMGRAVARRTGLTALLTRASRLPGRWDMVTEAFAAHTGHSDSSETLPAKLPCLSHDAFLDWFEHCSEAPPLPSVPLARIAHALFSVVARIEAEGRDMPLTGDAARSADFAGEEEGVTVELSREVRLALGPATGLGSVGALFESRARVRLLRLSGEEAATLAFYQLQPAHSLKPVDDSNRSLPVAVFQALIDGRWHRVATLDPLGAAEADVFDNGPDASPIDWRTQPWNPKSDLTEHWYLHWQAVTPAAVAHWFDRPDGGHQAIAITYDGATAEHLPAYPRGTLAHWLEQALDNGGLEAALTATVERMAAALDAHEAVWRADCDVRHIERLSRWHVSSDAVPEPSTDVMP